MEPTEVKLLPEYQKREFCLNLLQEFGAHPVRINDAKHELRHNCILGLGGHSDNNSFAASINYKTLEFNCWVCGFGGSLAWWVAVLRGEDVDDIEPWLKQRLGIGTSLPLRDLLKVIDDICHPPTEKKLIPRYPERILKRWTEWGMFHPYLTDPPEKGGRGIPIENLERFRIGYADEDEDFEYYQRIVIPAFWDNKLVGWQARRLWSEDPHPEKYRNSVDFPRDRILYGDVSARRAVVLESPMSVLRHIHQIPIVATFGSNVTDEQLRLLERFDELIICNENDKAGWKMNRLLSRELSRKVRLSIWESPYRGEWDAADFDDDTFMNLVDSAVPASIWEPKLYKDQIPYIRK